MRRCVYCQRVLAPSHTGSDLSRTREHPLPKWLGGRRIVPACLLCNNMKGDMHPADWHAFCQATPEWWKLPSPRRAAHLWPRPHTVRAKRLAEATEDELQIEKTARAGYGAPTVEGA